MKTLSFDGIYEQISMEGVQEKKIVIWCLSDSPAIYMQLGDTTAFPQALEVKEKSTSYNITSLLETI